METRYITIQELADHMGVSSRAIHFKLKAGEPIEGVRSYWKLNPAKKTSAYVIEADASYFKPKKKKR